MKSIFPSIVILFSLNCSTSWGSLINQGIWCEPTAVNTINDKKGFFFFDDIKVGSFSIYEPKIKNHRIHFSDLSPYKSTSNKVNWMTTLYDYELSVFTNFDYELDKDTLELSYTSEDFEENIKMNCIVHSERNFFEIYK